MGGSGLPQTQEGPEQRQLRPFSHACRSRSSPVAQTVGSRPDETRVPSLAASRMERGEPPHPYLLDGRPPSSRGAAALDAARPSGTLGGPLTSRVTGRPLRARALVSVSRTGSVPAHRVEWPRAHGNHAAHSAQLMCVGAPCHPIWPAPGLPATPRLPKSDRKHTPRRSELQRHALAARRSGARRAQCPTTPSATCSV